MKEGFITAKENSGHLSHCTEIVSGVPRGEMGNVQFRPGHSTEKGQSLSVLTRPFDGGVFRFL